MLHDEPGKYINREMCYICVAILVAFSMKSIDAKAIIIHNKTFALRTITHTHTHKMKTNKIPTHYYPIHMHTHCNDWFFC